MTTAKSIDIETTLRTGILTVFAISTQPMRSTPIAGFET
jgi:hypothetical protein